MSYLCTSSTSEETEDGVAARRTARDASWEGWEENGEKDWIERGSAEETVEEQSQHEDGDVLKR